MSATIAAANAVQSDYEVFVHSPLSQSATDEEVAADRAKEDRLFRDVILKQIAVRHEMKAFDAIGCVPANLRDLMRHKIEEIIKTIEANALAG